MFVDTDLLRMGADFSNSAGEIVKRGASQFASTTMAAGIFGDFDAAHDFQSALQRAHEAQVTTMQEHHAGLRRLADKANAGATIFTKQDEASEVDLRSAKFDIT